MFGTNTDNLITPDELANFLKISKSSIYRLVEERKLPFHKVGGSLRFKKEVIDKYLDEVCFEPIIKR
jgi:excisionase family DNA binding protein